MKLMAVVKGNKDQSSLTLYNLEYQRKSACNKDEEYYKLKISNKIENTLIERLQ
jgi:hypothetical protein